MNFQLLHDATFDVLYGCVGLLVFIILERSVYLSLIAWRMHRNAAALDQSRDARESMAALRAKDPVSESLLRYAQFVSGGPAREREEDYASALFIGFDKRVSARLWILDMVVTAAPLLGLLGTIFGIMETFNALAAGGVSDPAAVSRGIGTALMATAIGIATALLGLLGNSILNRRAHVITEDFKALLLRISSAQGDLAAPQAVAAKPIRHVS